MKKLLFILMMLLLPMVTYAYDIAVKNADGVTIYYNYINDGKELEVTYHSDYKNEYGRSFFIPKEVTYMKRVRKVTSIGASVFSDCSYLTSVTIPNSVTNIGEKAFENCNDLNSVHIPNSVTSIGEGAFSRSGLTSIHIPNSVTSISRSTFYECSKLTTVTIPNSVTSIGNNAFYNCTSLTLVTIPNSVTTIGDNAFLGCKGLISVTIGNSVTSIGYYAFSNCSALTSVTIPNSVTSIGNRAFRGCSKLTSVTIPNSVWRIGERAFSNCSSLTSVNIPNSMRSIGNYVFEGCTGLTSVTIPNSVTSIGEGAFSSCLGLTSVTIPNSVTSIGDEAFANCLGLTSITIPNSVMSIGKCAFDGADIPTVISLIETPFAIIGKQYLYKTFSNNTFNNATLYVPVGTIDKYKATDGWKDFFFIEEGTGGGETAIEKCAMPAISYKDGELSFTCDTEGVEFVANVECLDNKIFYDKEIPLSGKFKVSVYATKAGYDNSDVATEEIEVCGVKGDVNGDGEVNVTDIVTTVNIIMKGDN